MIPRYWESTRKWQPSVEGKARGWRTWESRRRSCSGNSRSSLPGSHSSTSRSPLFIYFFEGREKLLFKRSRVEVLAPLGQTQTRNADEDLFPTRIYHSMSCPNKFLLKYSVNNVLCVGLAFLNTLHRPKTFTFSDIAQILVLRSKTLH